MIASTEDFAAHIAGHAGLPADAADHAARTVLTRLGAYLSPGGRQLVGDELPAGLRGALSARQDLSLPLEEVVGRHAIPAGVARELIASVCRVLVEDLSTEALAELRAAVPAELARFLVPPDPELVRTPEPPARHATLASGRPGSEHPLHEAHATRTQPDSVAAANPHGDQKLSSAPGTTQERAHDTLAEARGETDRPLSGTPRR